MPPSEIRIGGLDKADVLELGEYVPEDAVEVEEQETPPGAFGELATATAIVLVSAMALKGFVAWLAYRSRGKKVEYEIEVRDEDGKVVKHTLKSHDYGDGSADAELAKQLSSITGFDAQALLAGP